MYPDLNGVKKILVIKTRQLGDSLLATPVFAALKQRLPESRITAYIYSESLPLLEGNPNVDDFLLLDRKKKDNLGVLYQVWKGKYDLVINLTEGDRGAMAAMVSGARIRVGFKPKGRWQKWVYTHVVKSCPTVRHNVERNLDALRCIGIFPGEKELFLPVDSVPLVTSKYVLVHPTSRWKFKCWPNEKMRELIRHLLEQGKKVVLTTGPDPVEIKMAEEIAKGLDVVNLAGKVSLRQLATLVKEAELLVCVDSLPFHMASALKAKVVALFGPTSDVAWGPWRNPGARVVTQDFSCRPCYQDGCGGSKHSECLATLPVESVVGAMNPRTSHSLLKQ